MSTFCSIVGARPNFVKLAALSPELRKLANEIIIHTGQHYDYNMSKAFFDDLDIPVPDYHLEVGSGSHGKQTGNMLVRIEKTLNQMRKKPDGVIVYGDTNTTLAGALAAAKMHIPVIHIEAGARSFDRRMPEEMNRVMVDHISDMLFCSTSSCDCNLVNEGIHHERRRFIGDVMVDMLALEGCADDMGQFQDGKHYLLTIHREENSNLKNLKSIFEGFSGVKETIIFPCHPRVRRFVPYLDIKRNVRVIEPVGYFTMRELERNAKKIITDSGGVQKEAYLLHVPCITLRESLEWRETLFGDWNVLTGADPERIRSALDVVPSESSYEKQMFGSPGVSTRIAKAIVTRYGGS